MINKISEEKLLDDLKKLANKLNTKKISKSILNKEPDCYSSATYKRVFGSWSYALFLAGLETGKITGRPWDKPILISDNALEILEGELLGDGSLELTPTSGNSGFVHSTSNFHYSEYLESKLHAAGISISVEILAPRNKNDSYQRRIRTQHNQSFRDIFSNWYLNGVKRVPDNLVLTKNKCLHWYLGDGYVENKNIRISTCGFRFDEVARLSYMLKGLGFNTSVDKHSGGYPILRFLFVDSKNFLDWIGYCPVIGYEHRWSLKRTKCP